MTARQTGYMPDLSKIRLDTFRNELKTGRLLPSRRPLLEGIDAKFALLEKQGLADAGALKEALSSNPKIERLAQKTGIPEDYFTLLKREVNNLSPTPVKFSAIPGISERTVKRLKDLRITSAEDLFPYIKDTNSRKELERISGLSAGEILRLTKLVDVSRVKWVGPKLARLIVDTKYDTVEKMAKADPADLLGALNEAKRIHKAYQGALGINDIESWIHRVVKKTPLVIEYE